MKLGTLSVSDLFSPPPCILEKTGMFTEGYGDPVILIQDNKEDFKISYPKGVDSFSIHLRRIEGDTFNRVEPMDIGIALMDSLNHLKSVPSSPYEAEMCQVDSVVDCIVGPHRVRKESWKISDNNRASIRASVESFMKLGKPIEMISLWGALKLLGNSEQDTRADLAEYLAIQRFNAINTAVQSVYPPGISARIILEDVGEPLINKRAIDLDSRQTRYIDSIRSIIRNFGGDHIHVCGESEILAANKCSEDEFIKLAERYTALFDQYLRESTTQSFGKVVSSPESLESFQALRAEGWQGSIPELQRNYYCKRIQNDEGRQLSTDDYIQSLSVYLGAAFARGKLGVCKGMTSINGKLINPLKASFVAYPPGTPLEAENCRIEYKLSSTPGSNNCVTPWNGIGCVVLKNDNGNSHFSVKVLTPEELKQATVIGECDLVDSSKNLILTTKVVATHGGIKALKSEVPTIEEPLNTTIDIWDIAFPPPSPDLFQAAFRKANRYGSSVIVDQVVKNASSPIRRLNQYFCEKLLQEFPIVDNQEPLVDLREIASHLKLPIQFLEEGPHFVRTGVARRLVLAAEEVFFRSGGEMLLAINEGYRSIEQQKCLFDGVCTEIREKHQGKFSEQQIWDEVTQVVADPNGTPPHSTGGAVDVTLYSTVEDRVVGMGCGMNEIQSNLSHTWNPNVPSDAWKNRCLLSQAMERVGFVNLATEYWHWSIGDSYASLWKGEPFAFYGSIKDIRSAHRVTAEEFFARPKVKS